MADDSGCVEIDAAGEDTFEDLAAFVDLAGEQEFKLLSDLWVDKAASLIFHAFYSGRFEGSPEIHRPIEEHITRFGPGDPARRTRLFQSLWHLSNGGDGKFPLSRIMRAVAVAARNDPVQAQGESGNKSVSGEKGGPGRRKGGIRKQVEPLLAKGLSVDAITERVDTTAENVRTIKRRMKPKS